MSLKKLIILCLLSFSTLNALQDFPKVHQALLENKNRDWVKKIVLNKEETRLLVMSRTSLELRDAKTLEVLKNIEFKGSAWDCDFVENGFVLLTHHDFTYFNSAGTNILYKVDRRDEGQIKKIDVQDNGYFVNMIKKTGIKVHVGHFDQDIEGVMIFNLRTKKYSKTSYKADYIKKHYLKDIRDNVVQISVGNHAYKYINIISGKDVNDSSLKTQKHNKKNILKAKDAWFYNPAHESYEFGCVSPNGKRYAIFPRKDALKVYEFGNKEPIFTLAYVDDSYSQKDCLIYNDTLVVQDKTLQVHDLKKDKLLYDNIDTSVKVMPIIGSCSDKGHGLSLWVKTMYGWDLNNGKMLWYSKGPKFNRSHWENASYYMQLNSDEKWAIVQPFGERAFGKELKVNLENGIYKKYKNRQKIKQIGQSKVCDPGREGGSGKKNSFTYLNLDFYSLNKGDWLIISPKDGYFSASSKRVLSILSYHHTSLSKQDINKWYRPDIIKAKLAKKDITKLKNRKTDFVLAKTSPLKNQYTNTVFSQIIKDKDYKSISSHLRKASMGEVKELYNVIQKSDTPEAYFTFYSALSRTKITKAYKKYYAKKYVPKKYTSDVLEYETFIQNNVKDLTTTSKEKPVLIRFLANIKQYDLLKELVSKSKLNLRSKKALASAYRVQEDYTDVLWDVWEKQNYIRGSKHIEFLYIKDPKRAQALAEKTLIYLLERNRRECPKSQTNRMNKLCQSDFDLDRYGNHAEQIKDLYSFLSQYTLEKSPKELKKITFEIIDTNLRLDKESYFHESAILIDFYIKYATKKEMDELKHLTRTYSKGAIFETTWDDQTWGDTPLSKKRIMIGAVMDSMIKVDYEYIMNTQVKIINSKNMKMHEALSSEIVDYKNPTIVTSVVESSIKQFKESGYVDNTYINKLFDTKDKKVFFQLIDMFNKFNNCAKVRDWYRHKLKEILTFEEYSKLKCVPLKNETIPYGRKSEYSNK